MESLESRVSIVIEFYFLKVGLSHTIFGCASICKHYRVNTGAFAGDVSLRCRRVTEEALIGFYSCLTLSTKRILRHLCGILDFSPCIQVQG